MTWEDYSAYEETPTAWQRFSASVARLSCRVGLHSYDYPTMHRVEGITLWGGIGYGVERREKCRNCGAVKARYLGRID